MKCIFILKENDELDNIGSDFLEEEKKDIIGHTFSDSPNETFKYTLYKIKDKKDAYILKTTRDLPNKEVWNHEKIKELYDKLKIEYSNEKERFIIAIHWGEINYPKESIGLCTEITKELSDKIRNNIILTHYSGKYDRDIIEQINTNGTNIDVMIDMIEERGKKELFLDKANRLYRLKEDLLRSLFPLTLGQKLEEKGIKEIRKTVESKNEELDDIVLECVHENDDKILKLIKSIDKDKNDKAISIPLESVEGQKVPGAEDYKDKLKHLREYLNRLIDEQLKKAGKKAIYGH